MQQSKLKELNDDNDIHNTNQICQKSIISSKYSKNSNKYKRRLTAIASNSPALAIVDE